MRRLKRLKASGSKPPYRSTLSRARDLSWSSVQPALATPITGMSRLPRLASACRAGNIFLWARSPVAPKNTSASEEGVFDAMPSFIGSDIVFMSLIAFPASLLFRKPHVLQRKFACGFVPPIFALSELSRISSDKEQSRPEKIILARHLHSRPTILLPAPPARTSSPDGQPAPPRRADLRLLLRSQGRARCLCAARCRRSRASPA